MPRLNAASRRFARGLEYTYLHPQRQRPTVHERLDVVVPTTPPTRMTPPVRP
jgi:hypothetical protein